MGSGNPFIFHNRKFHSVARVSNKTLGQFTFINIAMHYKYIIMTTNLISTFPFHFSPIKSHHSQGGHYLEIAHALEMKRRMTLFGCSFVKTKQRLVLFLYNNMFL